jgi:uncharacterized membrane protein
MKKAGRLLAAAFASFGIACGGSGGSSCPNDALICPTPAPSYASSISGIIENRCMVCHSPTGQNPLLPFTNYQQIFAARSAMLTQVHACQMPPVGATQPTAQERTLLLDWLTCGAPNN